MTRFPIVQRELLVSSRKRLTFWTRMVAAILAFGAVLLTVGIEPDLMIAGALGAKLFQWLTIAAFCACLFGGALLTADCLSVEKREGTLGLLFLTDLKGYDVVLGKLAAKSIPAVLCLLAIFPMLALPILLGGVTGGDFWRVVLVLLNTLFLSASIGMISSVFFREARNAIATAEFLLFVIAFAPMALSLVLPGPGQVFARVFSPIFSFLAAMPGPFRLPVHFYWSVFTLHVIGWICIAVTGRRAQTSWHEDHKPRPLRDRWRETLRGHSAGRLALRRLLLPINPILWMEARNQALRIGLICLFALLALVCWTVNRDRAFHWSDIRYSIGTVVFLHLLLQLLIAYHTSTRIIEAKQDGALTVVLSTRMSVEDVLRGELLAARRLFGWPLAIVLAFDASWMLGVIRYGREPYHSATAVIITVCLAPALLANCCALVWAGLHNSMRARRPYGGALRSVLEIVIAPVVWFGLVWVVGNKEFGLLGGVIMFMILNFLNTWLFGSAIYQRFKTDLRQILTEHPRPPEKSYDEDYALLN